MRRSATLVGVGALSSAALLLGLTACNTAFPGDDPRGGGPAGDGRSEPGRYSALPEPCGAPDGERLGELLPGADEAVLEGEPQVTYDSARRFGCVWQHRAKDANYELSVDYHRVLSYDPEVSDDDQAALDFAARAAEDGLPGGAEEADDPDGTDDADAGTDEGTDDAATDGADEDGGPVPDGSASPAEPDDPEDGPDGDEDGTGSEVPGEDGTTGADADSDEDASPSEDDAEDGAADDRPVPRTLDDIGTAAYLDDRLTDDGTRRDITLVFHSSNVIVAIDYAKIVPDAGHPPEQPAEAEDDAGDGGAEPSDGSLDGAALQERAELLARELADQFDT